MRSRIETWLLFIAAFGTLAPGFADQTGVVNQLGWPPTAFKTVVLAGDAADLSGSWSLNRKSDNINVAKGTIPASKAWAPLGGDPVKLVRLPDSLASGTYQLVVNSNPITQDLVVATEAWMPITKALLKGFYYQRAGIAIESKYAGQWARPIAHETGYASYHPSSGRTSGGRNSPKGWYDAGDYNKYTVNSGITLWNLLALAENYPGFVAQLKWGIPEDGLGAPSILAEARWNLEWMLTMQDDDGGVFHKWTQKIFSDFKLPSSDTSTRWMVGKSANGSYDFAAVMAQASRLWKSIDPAFSSQTLAASKKAWTWANAHQDAIFRTNPPDIATGQYEDAGCSDEKLWASAELAATTNDASTYLPAAQWTALDLPWWKDVGMLAAYAVVSHPGAFSAQMVAGARQAILSLATTYAERVATNAWASPQEDPSSVGHLWGKGEFPWGSNSVLAHMGIHMLYAWNLTRDSSYLRGADASLDHLLGRNPLGLCNVTGFGSKSPMKIHHRISAGDGIVAPVPGLLVGGAYGGGDDAGWTAKENWKCVEYRVSNKVSLDWLDDQCSYATNEIAINWNGAAAHLAASLTAIHGETQATAPWMKVSIKTPQRHNNKLVMLSGGKVTLDEASTVELLGLNGQTIWSTSAAAGQIVTVPRYRGVGQLLIRSRSSVANRTILNP